MARRKEIGFGKWKRKIKIAPEENMTKVQEEMKFFRIRELPPNLKTIRWEEGEEQKSG